MSHYHAIGHRTIVLDEKPLDNARIQESAFAIDAPCAGPVLIYPVPTRIWVTDLRERKGL